VESEPNQGSIERGDETGRVFVGGIEFGIG
jgi:hypothetical protein